MNIVYLQNLYCCAKMKAEMTATKEAAKRGLDLAVVVPSMTIGPTLPKTRRIFCRSSNCCIRCFF